MKRFVCHINSLLTLIGKPLALTGIIFILVTFIGACGPEDIPEGTDEIEYTDVEYSEDGTGVTLYLDGIGVPKTPAQRAMTKDLAQTAYDFIEVIFVNGDICRASWVLGKRAEIYNVTAGTYASTSAACMFAGRDDGKVLFGVGKLTHVNNVLGNTISDTTKSIRFTISPVQCGLLVGTETLASVPGVAYNSFSLSTGFRKNLGDGSAGYPVYVIPAAAGDTTATYTFSFVESTTPSITASDCTNAIKYAAITSGLPIVQKRTPRYAMGERYKEPRSAIDTKTTPDLSSSYTTGGNFNPAIGLKFTKFAGSGGLFAFNIQIPVYMVSNADNAAVTWFIRTGIGAELYSLDDGISRGGCVLMYVTDSGTASADFDKIEWTWFKGW